MREQDVRPRPRLEKAVLPLFLAGHRIRLDTLRRALIDEANRVREDAEILAGTRRSRREGRPNQALTAARLAEKLMHRGHLSKQTRRQRKAMLDRLSKPLRWTPDDPPETLLQDVFGCLIYTFLSGRLLPTTEDAIYLAFLAYGVEPAVKNLLPRIGVELEPNLDLVTVNLPKVSLPFVMRTLKRMKMADFERARDEYRQVQAVFGFLSDALRALFPEGVDTLSLSGVDWPRLGPLLGLTLTFDMRKIGANKQLDGLLGLAREQLPEWRASLAAGLQAGLFSDEARRTAFRADMRERLKEELSQSS